MSSSGVVADCIFLSSASTSLHEGETLVPEKHEMHYIELVFSLFVVENWWFNIVGRYVFQKKSRQFVRIHLNVLGWQASR